MIVMEPMFSILVVCLNPGGKIKETLRTIAVQNDKDYEVIIKDGFSTDGSLAFLEAVHEEEKEGGTGIIENLPFRLVRKKDTGIYDALRAALYSPGLRPRRFHGRLFWPRPQAARLFLDPPNGGQYHLYVPHSSLGLQPCGHGSCFPEGFP